MTSSSSIFQYLLRFSPIFSDLLQSPIQCLDLRNLNVEINIWNWSKSVVDDGGSWMRWPGSGSGGWCGSSAADRRASMTRAPRQRYQRPLGWWRHLGARHGIHPLAERQHHADVGSDATPTSVHQIPSTPIDSNRLPSTSTASNWFQLVPTGSNWPISDSNLKA